jgi:hypothetical protein
MAVIDLSTRDLHVLNALAAELWLQLHEGPTQLAAIAALWAERYGIDPATALADASACIEPWAAQGWIGTDSLGRFFIDRTPMPPVAASDTGAARPAADLCHRRLDLPGAAVDLGFGVTQAAPGPSLMARAAGLFSGIPERTPQDPRSSAEVALVLDGERHLVGENDRWTAFDDPQAALGALIRAVYRAAYPDDPAFVMLHAAALVGAGSRDLTVFPGISGAGKSTLTAFLVARGWRYATDDFIALTRPVVGRGPVLLPMPNAVSIKEGSLALLAPLYPTLKALPPVTYGGKTGRFLPIDPAAHVSSPLPVARLVFPRYVPGAAARLDPLPKGAALLGLVEASFSAEGDEGSEGFDPLFDWLEQTATFSLVYDDLEEARRCLQTLTDTPASAP